MAERIVGIDFGTSTSAIRIRRYQNGEPIDLVPNAVLFDNHPTVPTMIQKLPEGQGTYYGYDAEVPKRRASTFQNFKLELENPDEKIREKAKELTAAYLRDCLGKQYQHQSDTGFLGANSDTVRTYISYPVKWSEETRNFMVQATRNAGFPNVEGIDEAQACIQAVTEQYAPELIRRGYFKENTPCTILLIDMGAGTTDLVLCRHTPGSDAKTEILNTWPRKDEALFGGHLIDDVLYTYITTFFSKVAAVQKIPLSAFKAWKETIISPALLRGEVVDYFGALAQIENVMSQYGDEITLDFEPIDREKFEELTKNYLPILPKMISDMLNDAEIKGEEIDLVILTGGHSQWYFVREMLLGNMPQYGMINLTKLENDPDRIVTLERPQETVALGLVYLPSRKKDMANPIVTIEMENGDIIKAELYPDVAPNTVNNFISLVKKGFYDGVSFHRVIPGFMIQGGDPKGTGVGGPGYSIRGEFTANGFKNDLKHSRGVLSMARTMAPNSAGSQFFIVHEDTPHLDNQYAAFGSVIEGIEAVDTIASVRTDYNDRPHTPQVMKKVTVETFGVDYPEPEKAIDTVPNRNLDGFIGFLRGAKASFRAGWDEAKKTFEDEKNK